MRRIRPSTRSLRRAILATSAIVAFSAPAHAANVIFALGTSASGGPLASGPLVAGQQISTADGTVQVRLDDGSIISLVGDSAFSIGADGAVTVTRGSVTVVNGPGSAGVVCRKHRGVP